MQKILLMTLVFSLSLLWGASPYDAGQKLFTEKCSSCHAGFISADRIKENFFEKNNTLLHLKAPSVNMLAYAIMRGPKKVGDPSDPEMRQDEIEEYLKGYLEHPVRTESICDPDIMRYYETKTPIRGLSDADYAALARFFMEYKQHRQTAHPSVVKRLSQAEDLSRIQAEAKAAGKRIIIEASSPTCHYCKRMKREVIETPEVQKALTQGYVLVDVDISRHPLPFNLNKVYRHVTPSFFIVESNGTLVAQYPGSWKKHDFLSILREYRPRR